MSNLQTINESETPYYTWTEAMAIGHPMIDEDHRHIFDIANRLQAELLEDPEHSIVGEVLVELIEHTGGHFAREEALMQAAKYPGYAVHKHEHEVLMEMVNDLHHRFMNRPGNITADVAEFFRKSLIPHFMNWDMKLGRSILAAE